MPFHKVIGIDLGTTYSAVSIWNGREIQIIESALGARTVPSVVGLDPQGQVIVGTPAQNNLGLDPANTIVEVKREMGVYERESSGVDDPGEPRYIRFRGQKYLPQEISAFILMELKRQAEHCIGEPIHDAVITVPAYFKEPQRGATEDAAMMAKLNVRRLINEPTAAAVCFGADKVEDDRVHTYAVYDLGGGTFDVSIIQVAPGNVSVVGTGGNSRLGGGDFDDLIVEHALAQIRAEHGVDLSGDAAARQRIKREAEIRKRELAVAGAAWLNLPFLTPTLNVNLQLTRGEFEHLIEDLLQQSLRCLDEALDSAHESNGIERDEIEQVLLVGGSTRIARIRPLLAEHLGLDLKDVRSDISPDEVVARGAGIVAREFTPSDGYYGKDLPLVTRPETAPPEPVLEAGIELQDVTSHTLGILANRADFIPILPKDSRIPSEATKDNFINADAYKTVDVLIFQGEAKVAFDNTLIGRVPIELPEARERGYYRFAVTFALDQNGLLKVAVKCLNDDQIWRTDLQCSVRASADQIERRALELDRAMAAPVSPVGELPKPPRRDEERPAPPPVPGDTPAEFRMVARRSLKLIEQLPPDDRSRLLAAYTAFVDAVNRGAADVETLGDALDDEFHRIHRPT
jgi:molecular chaperone DnaK